MWNKCLNIIKNFFGKDLLGVIFFGSSVYGRGRDFDLIVIVKKNIPVHQLLKINKNISSLLSKSFNYSKIFDVHVFDLKNFEKNLESGSFVSGISLGYKILFDKAGLEEILARSFKKLKDLNYEIIIGNRRINLSKFAEIRYSLMKSKLK